MNTIIRFFGFLAVLLGGLFYIRHGLGWWTFSELFLRCFCFRFELGRFLGGHVGWQLHHLAIPGAEGALAVVAGGGCGS